MTGGIAETTFTYGRSTDQVLVGDWDGDGKDTISVRRGTTTYIQNALTGGTVARSINQGLTTDAVLVGDWDGDGVDSFALRRGSTSTTLSTTSSSSTTVSGVWAKLAQCESGGVATLNTGNGYYGLYQFSLATWRAMGGTGLPSQASAAEQTRLAQKLQAQACWGQWPACARKLGLL